MNREVQLFLRWLAAVVSLASLGCKPTASVHGVVKYNDELLTYGSVKILPIDGIPRDAAIQANGTYRFELLPCGPAQLLVYATPPEMVQEMVELAFDGKDPTDSASKPPAVREPDQWLVLPEKYGFFDRSGLALELQPGDQTFDLLLD